MRSSERRRSGSRGGTGTGKDGAGKDGVGKDGVEGRDRGSVTAEAAMVIPVLLLFALALVWALMAAAAQIRCVDAARTGARAAARSNRRRRYWQSPVRRRRTGRGWIWNGPGSSGGYGSTHRRRDSAHSP